MIYTSVGIILIVFIFMYKKHREVIKYIPVSHKGLINLYNMINIEKSKISLYKLYLNIILMFSVIVGLAVIFKLNTFYMLTIVIVSLILMPLIILWHLNFEKEAFEFNNLITYLNQFIIVFKSYPKVYTTLIEIESTIYGNLKSLVNEMIQKIQAGESSITCLNAITERYPHFILHNLHALVYNIEKYGTTDYFEALDLIQDDIDDWVEDVMAFNYLKKRIITKVVVLIGFALLICFMALKMLFSIDLQINGPIYQFSLLLFCLIQIFTYLLSASLLNSSWIEKSESLC